MKLIIEIPEELAKKQWYTDKEIWTVIRTVWNGTPIPDNAKNGDVIKTLFSNTFDNFCERTTWEWNRWWNSPYQKGGKK